MPVSVNLEGSPIHRPPSVEGTCPRGIADTTQLSEARSPGNGHRSRAASAIVGEVPLIDPPDECLERVPDPQVHVEIA